MTPSKAGELRDCGFSLIELLVVCSILAALSFVAWGGYGGVQASAEDDIARADLRRLADALKRFKADTGVYPGQPPFALLADDSQCIAGVNGGAILRSWAPEPAISTSKDDWFVAPANLALLFEAPALCAHHPLARLARWDPDTGRGWHGPYLDLGVRAWVDVGRDFNADSTSTAPSSSPPYGNGSPVAGEKIIDIPAFGNGSRYPAAGPAWQGCTGQNASEPGAACMLGWRNAPRSTPGFDAERDELPAHARPFVAFGLADGDHPRVVYFGPDGRYGRRNETDPCLPNLSDPDGYGADDVVLCLGS